jgi:hypothetical protein
MVHALGECWRVLRVGGRLIDLRPHVSGWPVEIVSPDTRILVGQLDDKAGISDDIASDVAVSEAVHRGWFERENEGFFEYAYYWDTVDEMNAYIETEWSNLVAVQGNVLSEARRLVQLTSEPVQIRIRRTMLIGSYRKLKARGRTR